jgi:hypothetical protein
LQNTNTERTNKRKKDTKINKEANGRKEEKRERERQRGEETNG